MLVHTVYFWLKPELTAAQLADFRKGVESLGGIKAVKSIYVGTPAKTVKRPIIDDSYSVALTVVCADIAGHDAYQVDPLHLAFKALPFRLSPEIVRPQKTAVEKVAS